MLLKLSVYDAARRFRGYARIELDLWQKKWLVVEDRQLVWWWVGFSRKGSLEVKSWDVIWLWDQGHNTVIFWDTPRSTLDLRHVHLPGEARIFDPKHRAFKEGKIRWVIDAPTPSLSALRKKARQHLEQIIPAPYGSQNWLKNPFHSQRPNKNPGYTNCVEFPAYLGHLLGDDRFPRGYPPTTTRGWTEADGVKRPLPGNVFILCKGAQRDGSTAHVGVIYDNSQGRIWKTADWGQGTGWDGAWVERTYDPVAGTLTGDRSSPFPQPRAIKGWVDIDVYFGNPKA